MTNRSSGDEKLSASRAPSGRLIWSADDWAVREFTCRLGPDDRRFEERHDDVTIAAVIDGTFQYRTAAGSALLCPGAFLLGNAGASFECGHDHGVGDRCIAISFEPALFEEIAATAAGTARYRFRSAMLPAADDLMLPSLDLLRGREMLATEGWILRFVETVVSAESGSAPVSARPSAQDERRITATVRHMEEHAAEPLSLDRLAAVAAMSKYHFLRMFRSILGVTPYQFLLSLRMRRAAAKLDSTEMPISTIAFDEGFGDLSTFNGRFRDLFAMSPGSFRRSRQAAGRAI
jgi:AraC family transcriptional regulator